MRNFERKSMTIKLKHIIISMCFAGCSMNNVNAMQNPETQDNYESILQQLHQWFVYSNIVTDEGQKAKNVVGGAIDQISNVKETILRQADRIQQEQPTSSWGNDLRKIVNKL